MTTKSKYAKRHGDDFDLGLAILQATRPPGYIAGYAEIAAYCGVNRQSIWMVEFAILQKLRRKYLRTKNPVFIELAAQLGIKQAQK